MVTVHGDIAVFRFYRPGASSAFVAGEFNRWRDDEIAMVRSHDGYWVAVIQLPPGTYRFKYYVDGRWYNDFAAFGIEMGPFGPESILRITGPKAHAVPAAAVQAIGA